MSVIEKNHFSPRTSLSLTLYIDDLKAAGIDEVLVYCVNDPAVMQAWSMDLKTGPSFITLMGDPAGDFTEALDLQMTHPGPPSVGIIGRSKRFALLVEDGKVIHVAVSEGEDDPAGDADPSASCAPALLEVAKEQLKVNA